MAFKRIFLTVSFLIASLITPTLYAANAAIGHIKQLLDKGKNKEAYEYAKKLEAKNIGDPTFDLNFARAAIAANDEEKAVFPLKRVIMNQPNNFEARALLGRVYFDLQDYNSARYEFDSITAANPPKAIQDKINQYTEAIDARKREQVVDYGAFGTFFVGADSNVNSATADTSVPIPIFGTVVLTPNSVKQSDGFVEYSAGLWGNKPFNQRVGIFGFAQSVNHMNFRDHEFDQATNTFVVGPTFTFSDETFRMPVLWQELFLDGDDFREVGSASLEWSHKFSGVNVSSLYVQGGYYEYPTEEEQDVDYVLAGLNWRNISTVCPITSTWGIYGSHEHATHADAEYNGRNFGGLQANILYELQPKHALWINASGYYAKYEAIHPIFLVTREDWQALGAVGYIWKMTPKLSFNGEVDYVHNHSNISIFHYDRWIGKVGFRLVV